MNTTTNRQPAPAAPGRFGRSSVALPHDPGLDELLADPDLGSTAKAIAVALVKNWAWVKDHCWPSDKTIAAKVGKSPGHVQRCLKQLEAAGWVEREKTAAVPTGRRIWLCWRRPGDGRGARRSPAPARGRGSAPARDKHVVIEQGEVEPDVRPAPERQRPGSPPPPVNPMAAILNRVMQAALAGPETAPPAVDSPTSAPPPATTPGDQEASCPPREADRAGTAEAPVPAPRATPASSSPPSAAPPRQPPAGSLLAGLTREEQARFWELPEAVQKRVVTWLGLGDRICLAEAKRLLAPLPPPEPPPSSLPTAELLASLPGRPDRVAAAAGRLAAELGDPGSYVFYRSAAAAVSARRRPASALVSAWRQGVSPKAARPGAVFTTAWRREARAPVRPAAAAGSAPGTAPPAAAGSG
jgi:hypothetical protein